MFEDKTTLRLTDTKVREKLSSVYGRVQEHYRGKKNRFLEDCIARGLDSVESEFIQGLGPENFTQMVDAIQEHTEILHKFLTLSSAAFRDIFKATMLNKMMNVRSYQMFLELQERDSTMMDDILGGMHYSLPAELEDEMDGFLATYPWYNHANTQR